MIQLVCVFICLVVELGVLHRVKMERVLRFFYTYYSYIVKSRCLSKLHAQFFFKKLKTALSVLDIQYIPLL